jgi:hypothetical protein
MSREIKQLADQVADLIRANYADLPPVASAHLMAAGRTMARGGVPEASDDPDAVHRAVRQGYAMSRMLAGEDDDEQSVKL